MTFPEIQKRKDIQEFLNGMATAPDGQIATQLIPEIKELATKPTALECLHIIDKMIYSSLASGFTLYIFQEVILQELMKIEGITYDKLVDKAYWCKGE